MDKLNICNILSQYRSWLMGISMLAIMLFHQHFLNEFSFPWFIFSAFGYLGVDIFLFLSGLGLVRSLKKYKLKVFYIRRLLRLIPLCIIVGGGKTAFCYSIGIHDFISWKTWLGFDMWFVKLILLYYISMPFFDILIMKYKIKFLYFSLVLAVISVFFQNNLLFQNIFLRLPIFLLGIYFGNNLLCVNIVWKRLFLPIFIILIITKLLKIFHFLPSFFDGIVLLLFVGIAPMACFYLTFLFKGLEIIKFTPIIHFLGKHSLELYLWHEFVFYYIANNFSLGLSPIWILVLAILLSVFLSYCSYMVLQLFLILVPVRFK